jgi:hypothetical protein
VGIPEVIVEKYGVFQIAFIGGFPYPVIRRKLAEKKLKSLGIGHIIKLMKYGLAKLFKILQFLNPFLTFPHGGKGKTNHFTPGGNKKGGKMQKIDAYFMQNNKVNSNLTIYTLK